MGTIVSLWRCEGVSGLIQMRATTAAILPECCANSSNRAAACSVCDAPAFSAVEAGGQHAIPPGSSGAAMKEALQSALILVLWVIFWLAGTIGGAVLQAWLVDIGIVSGIDPPWVITIGSSFIGFFAGAYAAVKLGDLGLKQK
jgi:hypothetical protein